MRLVIDCNNLCYMSFYALGGLEYNGKSTGVIYGFLNQLYSLCRKHTPDQILFCWDSRKSYRKKMYPEYKANRSNKSEEELQVLREAYEQFNDLREHVLPSLGFQNNYQIPGYEADDIIAWLVWRCPDDYIIVSGDQDLYQLLQKTKQCETSILSPSTGKMFTYDMFYSVYGLSNPCIDWVKAKAIGGCDSDNVKGIYGVADPAKSNSSKAIEYLKGNLTKGKIYDKIVSEEGQQIIKRNTSLVFLPFQGGHRIDLEIKDDTLYARDFRDVFSEYGFDSLRKELGSWIRVLNLKMKKEG